MNDEDLHVANTAGVAARPFQNRLAFARVELVARRLASRKCRATWRRGRHSVMHDWSCYLSPLIVTSQYVTLSSDIKSHRLLPLVAFTRGMNSELSRSCHRRPSYCQPRRVIYRTPQLQQLQVTLRTYSRILALGRATYRAA